MNDYYNQKRPHSFEYFERFAAILMILGSFKNKIKNNRYFIALGLILVLGIQIMHAQKPVRQLLGIELNKGKGIPINDELKTVPLFKGKIINAPSMLLKKASYTRSVNSFDLNGSDPGVDYQTSIGPNTFSVFYKSGTSIINTSSGTSQLTFNFSNISDTGTKELFLFLNDAGNSISIYFDVATSAQPSQTWTLGGVNYTVQNPVNGQYTLSRQDGNNIPDADMPYIFSRLGYFYNNATVISEGIRQVDITAQDAANAMSAIAYIDVANFPVAVDDAASIAANDTNPLTGNLLSNDTDATPGDVLSVYEVHGYASIVGAPYQAVYGTITVNSNGTFSYALDVNNITVKGLRAGDTIEDIVEYGVEDINGHKDTGYIVISINGVNEAPNATNNAFSVDLNNSTHSANVIYTNEGYGLDTSDKVTALFQWENYFNQDEYVPGTSKTETNTNITLNFTGQDPDNIGISNYDKTVDQTGTNGGHTGYLRFGIDASFIPVQDDVFAVDFSAPVVGLSFTIADIDNYKPNWQDQVQIIGTNAGQPVAFTYSKPGSVLMIGSDTFYGTGSVPATEAGGNVTVRFAQPIDHFEYHYNYGPDVTEPDPSGQIATLTDLIWQPASIPRVYQVNGNTANVGVQIATTYGFITVNGDGSYTYTLDNTNPTVQNLLIGQTLTDNIPYTIIDSVDNTGQTANANIIVTINGTQPDSDNDGIGNNIDLDDDNDGIPDSVEGNTDLDGDGKTNDLDLDADNDGIYDIVEAGNAAADTDHDGRTNNAVGANGLDDTLENNDTATASITYTLPNTDTNGNADFLDIDADDDGIVDNIEGQPTTGYVAPGGTDSDNNGVDDAYDTNGTWINPVNTDGVDNPDYTDTDSDNDGRADSVEGWDTNNDGVADTVAAGNDADSDGLDDNYDNDDTQINPTNNQTPASFPDVNRPGNGDRDWRQPLNQAPIAYNDVTSTLEDVPFNGDVFANNGNGVDTDPDGDAISVASATIDVDGDGLQDPLPIGAQTSIYNNTGDLLGKITLNSDGTFSFNPALNFNGNFPQVTYTISDPYGLTASATLDINVTPVNDAPVAVDDNYTTAEDTSVALTPLTNDSDPDLDPVTITGINGTAFANNISIAVPNGTVTVDNTGNISFTPAANYNGPVSFPYTISDGNGGMATANINITVTAVNDNPVAVDDPYTTAEDTAVVLAPLTNDSDVDMDPLTVSDINGTAITPGTAQSIPVSNGTVNVDAAGNITFVPDANYNGPVSFPYTISDGNGGTATANINITVTAVNDAPVAVDDNYTTVEDTSVALTPLTNDSDPDLDPLTITDINGTAFANNISIAVPNGTVTVDNTGNISFTPAANYNGPVSFPYTISDGNGGMATANINITVTAVNDNPVAVDDPYTTAEDTAVVLAPLTNDSDVDMDPLTVSDINGTAITPGTAQSIPVSNGTVNVDAAGNITFVPDANYNGPVSFPYTISDGNGGTATANINITVTAVNDDPVATDNVYNGMEDNNVTGNIITDNSGFGVDADIDGDLLSVSQFEINGNVYLVPAGNNNTATISGMGDVTIASDGSLTFVPVANYNGTLPVITYTLNDNNGGTDTANVTINIASVNDMPVANDDSTTTMLDTPVTFNATDNDDDIDGTIDTATVDLDPSTPAIDNTYTDANGNVWTVDSNGDVTFTPASGFTGIASIQYTVNDNEGGTSNPANLSVFVQNPELTVTKDDGMDMTVPQNLTVGQIITYTITVTNSGNVALTNINVTDANAVITAGNPIANLAPGNSVNVTATHTVTQADIDNGSIENTAQAETFFNGTPVRDDSDDTDPASGAGNDDPTFTNLLQNPELTVFKDDAIPVNASVGDDIVYTITVRNTGNVTLTNVVVTDANAQMSGNNTIAILAPGNSVNLTATHTITQADMNNGSISNTAVATSSFNGNPVSDMSDDVDPASGAGNDDPTISDLSSYQNAEITATLDDNDPSSPTNPSTYFAGDNINYTLNVENTGNVSVTPTAPAGYTAVLQGGNNVGDINGNGLLDPGEIWVYTGSHTLTQPEIDAGVYTTQLTVNALDPNNATISDLTDDPITNADNDPTKTYFDLVSEIDVKKQDVLPLFVMVGNDITYTLTVTNNGNTSLSNINITDPNAQNITYVSGDTNNNNQMEPSETWIYSATHTITQADMDAGFVSNQASASSTNLQGDPINDDASDDPDTPEPNDPTVTDLHAYQNPSITAEKTVTGITDNGLAGDSAADVVHYQISVQNTGNVTISSLQIIDTMISDSGSTVNYSSGDLDNDGYLDVNETWVYTADYTITQSDMDNGVIVNSAVAYGINSNGTPLNDVSDDPNYVPTPGNPDNDHNPTITNLTQNPQLDVTKQDANLPAGTTVGDYITYTIVVTNTGNVTLDNVSVSDTNAVMNGVGSTPALAPGDSVTFTAVHQITQADMNNGIVINQATATATDPNNNNVSDLSDDPDTITPNDPTETDLTPYQVVSMEATLDDNLQTNANNPYNFNVGDPIIYTATLTNTGNVSLTPTTPAGYTEMTQGGVNVGDTNGNGLLDMGETWIYTTTHLVTQADIDAGHYDNQVTFDAMPANGSPMISDVSDDPQDMTTTTNDVTITYIGQFGQLLVLKTGVFDDLNADGLANVGETVTFTITAENTGNLTINNINVMDTNAQNVTYVNGDVNSNGAMDPGELWTYTAVHTLTQADIDAAQVENQATVTGQDTAGNNISDISDDPNTGTHEDATIVTVPVHAELTMTKTGIFTDGSNNNGYADVGEMITYTFEVHNAGNQTLVNITIEDPDLTATGAIYVSGDTNGNNLLDVGEDWIFTGTHELTQADIDAGKFENQALVTGEDPEGNTINDLSDDPNDTNDVDQEGDGEPDDPTVTLIPQHPELSLIKTGIFNDENGDGLAQIGETISYNFVVTNIGDVTLTDIDITDALPGVTVSGTPIILLPGDSDNSTFTAQYTLTANDIDNGFVSNSAIVSALDPQGNTITDKSDDGLNSGPNADPDNDGEPDDPTVITTLGIDIATIFTPDGDGTNDTWQILGIQNFHHNVVKVYNRWGNLVYKKDYYTGNWDGTSNGKLTIGKDGKLPVGTYFYIIDLGNGHKPFTGYLYLNR